MAKPTSSAGPQLDRRRFLALTASGGAAATSFSSGSWFDLDEVTLAELRQRLDSGRETARSLVDKYLQRIDEIDRRGPTLRSVIEINPDAAALAQTLDAERQRKKWRGPLH